MACLSGMLWPELIANNIISVLLISVIPLFYLRRYSAISFILGVIWFNVHASVWFNWQPDWIANNRAQAQGHIIQLKQWDEEKFRVDLKLDRSWKNPFRTHILRLSWSTSEALVLGQYRSFIYRPKRLTSSLNEGTSSGQKRFAATHIVAQGKVIEGQLMESEIQGRWPLIHQLYRTLVDYKSAPFMLALMTGQRYAFAEKHWKTLRYTGVGHLFAISGLHLAMIMLFVSRSLLFVLGYMHRSEGLSHYYISHILGLCACVGFAWISGYCVSTQRALVMLCCVVLYQFLRCSSTIGQRLNFALCVVLFFDPLASLSAGFWLSFSALCLILLFVKPPQKSRYQWVLQCIGLQFWLSLGMGFIQAVLFGGVTVHSLWLNMLYVPLFSFLIIPLAFFALVMYLLQLPYVALCFDILDFLLLWMVNFLEEVATWQGHWIEVMPRHLSFFIGCIVFVGLLLYRHYKLSQVMLLALLGFVVQTWHINKQSWWLHMLDVGQGLAFVIERNQHALIYDTGAAYPSGFSYAERVIDPFLKSRGIQEVDTLIVSHVDNDHAGGVRYLKDAYPQAQLIANPDLKRQTAAAKSVKKADRLCLPQKWQWMGLDLEIIWPDVPRSSNFYSCVVSIKDHHQHLLLTGDLNQKAEKKLLEKMQKLSVDILQVPHHGSRTSSSRTFLEQLKPDMALISSGLDNIYGFPHPDILSRYQKQEIKILNTAYLGQVSFRFMPSEVKVSSYRHDQGNYWFNQVHKLGNKEIKE
tara:strand:- start:5835 stop:8087 length:2253 start_codon:yes stop_codon:yes gene_type:complete